MTSDRAPSRTGTTVVNVRSGEPFDVYIGRTGPWSLLRPSLTDVGWGNKFTRPRDRLARYEHYVRHTPALVARLPELRGKRLGCWCAPAPCHGDVLVRLVDELCE